MKTYCKQVNITSHDHLSTSYDALLARNRNRKGFSHFYSKDKEAVIQLAREMIENRKLELNPIVYFERIEPTCRKTRLIGRESAMQQFFDYIAVSALQSLFDAKIGYHQCASIAGKGQSHARRYLKRWSRNARNRYYVKIDIRKFYQNVDREVLISMLRHDVRNDDLLWLVQALIETHRSGVNIGSYLSQYLANYYLSGAFRFANELHKMKRGKRVKLADHVLTYMDDWIFIGSRKADVKSAVRQVIKYLNDVLHLEVKPWKVCKIDDEPIDMVGFVFWRDHITIRASIFIRARRAFSRIRKAKEIKLRQAQRCISYYGFFKWSSTKQFQQRIEMTKLFNRCKDRVAAYQYERNAYESSQLIPT